MIESLIAYSIRHRLAVVIAGFALAIAGAYAAYTTPVDAIPDLSENQVVVFTEWPGHSPREVEDQIGYPLSTHLQGLRGVRTVRSSSDFHFSMIHVIFADDVDFPTARLRVLERPGVAEVASVGGFPIEYQVNVDPRKLRTRGATLAEVVRAVGDSNATVGGPIIQKGNAEYIVRSLGWLGARSGRDDDEFDPERAVRDLERAVLAAEADGSILHVGDVASVTIGPALGAGSSKRTAARSSAAWC